MFLLKRKTDSRIVKVLSAEGDNIRFIELNSQLEEVTSESVSGYKHEFINYPENGTKPLCLKYLGGFNDNKGRKGEFECVCGKIFIAVVARIATGATKSCGCLIGKAGKHHNTNHPLYPTYKTLLARCYNPKHRSYKNYGGRGITVCDKWRDETTGFQNFLGDMGNKPEGTSIERIDNNLGYSKFNCKWETSHNQTKNKRNSYLITIEGRVETQGWWIKHFKTNTYRLAKLVTKFSTVDEIASFCKNTKSLRETNTGWYRVRFDKSKNKYLVSLGKSEKALYRYSYFTDLESALHFVENVLGYENIKCI